MICEDCGVEYTDGKQVRGELIREPEPGKLRIAIVGEAPGEVESKRGTPFVEYAPSGRFLRTLLRSRGIDPDECLLTNVICHQPKNNATPNREQVERARTRLVGELQAFKPDRILCCGVTATAAILGWQGKSGAAIKSARGIWKRSPFLTGTDGRGVWSLPTLHPALVLRVASAFDDLDRDVERLLEDPEDSFGDPKVYLVRTFEEAVQAFHRLTFQKNTDDDGIRCLDVETEGFDPQRRSLICVGIASSKFEAFVWTEEALWDKQAYGVLRSLGQDPRLKYVGHNIDQFDAIFLNRGVQLRFPTSETPGIADLVIQSEPILLKPWGDTMLWHYATDERTNTHGLKPIAAHVFGVEDYEKEVTKYLDKTWGYRWCPRPLLYKYLGYDCTLGYALCKYLMPKMNEGKLWSLYQNVMKPAAKMLGEIRFYGVQIDRPYLEQLDVEWDKELQKYRDAMIRIVGNPHYNPNSVPQTQKVLYQQLKLPQVNLKDVASSSGEHADTWVSTADDVLNAIKEHDTSGFITHLQGYRRLAKLKSTYVKGILDRLDERNCLYPEMLIHGTETGRLSSRNQNIQNIPKHDYEDRKKQGLVPYPDQIRYAFMPRPGYKLVDIDYCLSPETRVLCEDFVWRRIDSLEEGQELVGFDYELGPDCRFKVAKVTSLNKIMRPSYRITTSRGPVVCSAEHKWVVRTPGQQRKWREAQNLRVGDSIAYFTEPWEQLQDEYEVGYLAGIFDGEASFNSPRNAICFNQNPGPTLEYVKCLLDKYQFNFRFVGTNGPTCQNWSSSGFDTMMRFLGTVRPQRFYARRREVWEGKRTGWIHTNGPAIITNIEYLGEQEVIALGTNTHTLIAEGFMSSNSQLEYRVCAWYCRDPGLIAAFNSGMDFHKAVAAQIYNVKPEQVTKNQRHSAKFVNFGIMYGRQAKALSQAELMWAYSDTEPCTVKQAQEFLDNFLSKFPLQREFMERIEKQVIEDGYVESYYGRRRRFPFIPGHKEKAKFQREARNMPIQGMASDICLLSAVKIHNTFPSDQVKVLFLVHDAIVMEVKEDIVDELVPKIVDIMENPDLEYRGFKFAVEAEVMQRWAKNYLEEDE